MDTNARLRRAARGSIATGGALMLLALHIANAYVSPPPEAECRDALQAVEQLERQEVESLDRKAYAIKKGLRLVGELVDRVLILTESSNPDVRAVAVEALGAEGPAGDDTGPVDRAGAGVSQERHLVACGGSKFDDVEAQGAHGALIRITRQVSLDQRLAPACFAGR